MGARHPIEVVVKSGANKNEFIIACRHLIRKGIVTSPGDAIRYIEEHDIDIQEVIDDYINNRLTTVITKPNE